MKFQTYGNLMYLAKTPGEVNEINFKKNNNNNKRSHFFNGWKKIISKAIYIFYYEIYKKLNMIEIS